MPAKRKPPKRKPAARRRPTVAHPPAMMAPADALNSLTLLVGQIGGKLDQHIDAVTVDRAERDDDRRESVEYRREMRTDMDNLKEGVGKIAGLTTRLDAVEKVTGEYKSFRSKLAGGVLVLGVFSSFIVEKIKKVFS